MRADVMARRQPIANLRFIHEWFRNIALGNVPVVLLAQRAGDEKLNRAKLVSRQDLQSVSQRARKSVIESNYGSASARFELANFIQHFRNQTGTPQCQQLFIKSLRAYIEKGIARSCRGFSDFMVSENWHATPNQPPLGCFEKNAI